MLSYKRFMFDIISYMQPNNKHLTEDIETIFTIQKQFEMLQSDEEAKRNLTYRNMTIAELEKQIPLVIKQFKIRIVG